MDFIIKELKSVNNPRSIHGIYPYRGKIAALDAEQILSQMPKGSIVLDPFCGSGTIVYEGLKYGLHTIGIDANPIAVTLSNGKIHIPLSFLEVKDEVNILINKAKALLKAPTASEYPTSLFHEKSLNEIMRMSVFYDEMSDYVKACFLGTIALTARGCNDYKWTSSTVGKNIEPKRYIPFYDKFQLKVKKHFLPIENDSMVYYEDSRNLDKIIKPNSVDFIFSSPPYFDCLDYTAYYARIIYDILRQFYTIINANSINYYCKGVIYFTPNLGYLTTLLSDISCFIGEKLSYVAIRAILQCHISLRPDSRIPRVVYVQ